MAPPDPSVTRIDGPWRHLDVHANGIRFHVVEAMPANGVAGTPSTAQPLVIMLHGFADTGDMWAPLAAVLVKDHTVIVPDLRGMGLEPADPDVGVDEFVAQGFCEPHDPIF